MSSIKAIKAELHPRNKHQGRYDFDKLIGACAELKKFVAPNKYGDLSIDFFDPLAVKTLNKALLAYFYNVEFWEIPDSALTPAIPSRADYIHYAAELISGKKSSSVRCLDIGVGANCIYPIIGCSEYGWNFVGSDISLDSINNAQAIVDNNSTLRGKVELRHQSSSEYIFENIINRDEFFDLSICNPPFHDSAQSAQKATMRKMTNLKGKRQTKATLNFGGQSNELWCQGGEAEFIAKMIKESALWRANCRWFTCLVSNEDNLARLERLLVKEKVNQKRIIQMQQGNKKSRILAWSF